jgi:hypothetical protein
VRDGSTARNGHIIASNFAADPSPPAASEISVRVVESRREFRNRDAIARPILALRGAAQHVQLKVGCDGVIEPDVVHAAAVRVLPELFLGREHRLLGLLPRGLAKLIRLVVSVEFHRPTPAKPELVCLSLLFGDPCVDVCELGVTLDDDLVDVALLVHVERLDGFVNREDVHVVLVQDDIAGIQGVGLEGEFSVPLLRLVSRVWKGPAFVRPGSPVEVLEDNVERCAGRHWRTVVTDPLGGNGVGRASTGKGCFSHRVGKVVTAFVGARRPTREVTRAKGVHLLLGRTPGIEYCKARPSICSDKG